MDQNINQLLSQGVEFAKLLKSERGYNGAHFKEIHIQPEGTIFFYFDLQDDFQRDISYSHRFKAGTMFILPEELTLVGWPTREERELRVMLAQQGESTALSDLMVSAAGRAFVTALKEERSRYAQLVDFSK